jgi:hypothetical protein
VRLVHALSASALALLLLTGSQAFGAEKQPPKEKNVSFGTLRALSPEEARGKAEAWLKGVGKADVTTTKEFQAVWADESRTVVDRVADTFALGDAEARKLLADAKDPKASAPTEVPAALKDAKDAFFRANLALAYAKALSGRRVYEESLEALKAVKAEQVCDPAAYLFHKAVAEHALMLRKEADESIVRLLDDVADAPERYKMVGVLMHYDMLTWKDKDLGWIARKMDNIERRLDLSRGGPQTQKMQKEVVMRLDELIKEKENQQKGGGS